MKKIVFCLFLVILLTACQKQNNDPIQEDPIDVIPKIKSLRVDPEKLDLEVGESYQLTYEYIPLDYQINSIIWESLDEKIATVENGKITALKAGICQIVLNIDDKTCVIDVTVNDSSFFGPAPEIINQEGLTYINGILIVNKTYSLPVDYNPKDLNELVKIAYNAMAKRAKEEGVYLTISTGYRSYSFQDTLYHNWIKIDGSVKEADRHSARPGHSEHQTGLAIDIKTQGSDGLYVRWGKTYDGQWVKNHCAEYGFIIRYPENKEEITGYSYEPWHLRYLGTKLAKELTESGLTLEEYLNIDSRYADN